MDISARFDRFECHLAGVKSINQFIQFHSVSFIAIAGKLAARIARKDSLAIKLAMRPDRQELIDRGILHAQTERERHMQREAVGARLTRSH